MVDVWDVFGEERDGGFDVVKVDVEVYDEVVVVFVRVRYWLRGDGGLFVEVWGFGWGVGEVVGGE